MKLRTWTVCLSLLLPVVVRGGPPTPEASAGKVAVVVGNNRGGERQKTLRYAERDAERVARLLTDLGGFAKEDVVLLTGEGVDEFRAAMQRVDERIARAPRAMLVVYFSGHADGIHLEMGADRLAYTEFRERIEASPAGIKIAFIDSCQSGGLIARKGGTPGPSFDLTVTDHIDASGTVVVTSSSAGENSQESGEIQGSFFSHYLLSGLRGAADHDRDRRVTLAEVYRYTYDKTVVETARTMAGTQHPAYEYQIEGRGRVVLTDLARGEATLRFGRDTAGAFLVIRRDSDEVLAELTKAYGAARDLSLPAGAYRVARRHAGRFFVQEVRLARGDRVHVDLAGMREEGTLIASLKEGAPTRSGFGVFVHYGLMSGALKNFAAVHQAMAGIRLDLGPVSIFPRIGYGQGSIADEQLDYRIRLFSFDGLFTWRFAYSMLDLFCGVKLGVSWGSQMLPDDTELTGSIFSYGAVGGVDIPLHGGLALQIFWEIGGEVFTLDEELSQHLALKGVVGFGYQF